MNTASLVFGAINLTGTRDDLAQNGWLVECTAAGTDWDNPVPIDATVTSWLQDGAIIARSGYNNRPDMTVSLRVTGVDANKVALAEQALVLETGKPNELVWTPPGVDAEPCVFSVVMSNLEHQMDDQGEIKKSPYRVYVLRIQAEPFVHAVDAVTVTRPAPTPSGSITVTTVDNCSSATNWSGIPNTPTAVSGLLKLAKAVPVGVAPGRLSMKRSGLAVNMASTPFLRVEFNFAQSFGTESSTVFINGVGVSPVASSGDVRWYPFSGTLNTVEVAVVDLIPSPAGSGRVLAVIDVSRSNAPADPGDTGRQVSGTMAIEGSARSQGSLLLEDPTNALGDVLVYTSPVIAGMLQPPLRKYLSPGPTPTVDGTSVSGVTSPLSTTHEFVLPASGLTPGGHLLLARVKHASTGPQGIAWTTYTRQGSTDLDGIDQQTGVTSIDFTAGVWQDATLARLNLPSRRVGADGEVVLVLFSLGAIVLDEAWLFNVEVGALTQVKCGTGTGATGGPSNRLFLDAPTVASPRPAAYLGHAADRSDSYHAAEEMQSFGVHAAVPQLLNIFTKTTGSTASVAHLTHFAHYLSHVAKVS